MENIEKTNGQIEIEEPKIKEDIMNQLMFDYLKENYPVELDKLINQFDVDSLQPQDEFLDVSSISSFLMLENIVGPHIGKTIRRYFQNIDYDFDINPDELNHNDLILIDAVLNVYSRPDVTNKNQLSFIIESLLLIHGQSNKAVRKRMKKDEI